MMTLGDWEYAPDAQQSVREDSREQDILLLLNASEVLVDLQEKYDDVLPEGYGVSDMLTSRPPVYGVISTWKIHDTDGKEYKLYQAGPQSYVPISLIKFAHAVASAVRGVEETYSEKARDAALDNIALFAMDNDMPTGRILPPGKMRPTPALGPITREIWYRMTEMYISLENFVNRKRPQPPKVAFVWEVWAVDRGDVPVTEPHPGCEIAFTAYDRDGVPDDHFTFDRMKPDEMINLLEARDLLKKTFKL